MTDMKMNELNRPGFETEMRAEQLSSEFRAGRIMLRIFAAGVADLAVIFGYVVARVFSLWII